MKPEIRAATVFDWKSIFTICRKSLSHVREDDIAYLLRTYLSQTRVMVDSDSKRVVGYWIHIGGKKEGMAWLEHIAIDPSVFGHNLGKVLLQDYETFCIDQGYTEIRMAVQRWNERAIRFYDRQGYERDEASEDDVNLGLRKKLPSASVAEKRVWGVSQEPLPGLLTRTFRKMAYQVLVR